MPYARRPLELVGTTAGRDVRHPSWVDAAPANTNLRVSRREVLFDMWVYSRGKGASGTERRHAPRGAIGAMRNRPQATNAQSAVTITWMPMTFDSPRMMWNGTARAMMIASPTAASGVSHG